MVAYIKQIAEQLGIEIKSNRISPSVDALLDGLNEELATLDARDFLPAARFQFVYYRKILRRLNNIRVDEQSLIRDLLNLLNSYGGVGSRAVSRSFAFVQDGGLRTIIERDYRELCLILFPSEAWKSTVIMAGSILEAILFDLLTRDSNRSTSAQAAKRAPKGKGGAVLPLDEWRLAKLIEVAVDLQLLPVEREKSVDQSLRDYRNFVHPNKETRAAHPCSEAEALLAKGALDGICNYLTT